MFMMKRIWIRQAVFVGTMILLSSGPLLAGQFPWEPVNPVPPPPTNSVERVAPTFKTPPVAAPSHWVPGHKTPNGFVPGYQSDEPGPPPIAPGVKSLRWVPGHHNNNGAWVPGHPR
jgi:hypothetical protein